MEVNNHEIGDSRLPVQAPQPEAATLDIIRTETVLSRLPVHNLAKKGSISIQILKKTPTGEVELLWRISPSRDYGEPRQLAYKLDTIIINQRIDEAGRPLPKLLRLGSLNDICAELGLTLDHGTNAKNIRNAFLQNALTGITAKFNYKANDGTERRLEAGFTRYSVIFTGEKLPDGRKADAVYIIFNEPFWEVLNSAPVRPLDRAYMKELPPAAQRFYEIVSRKIFAALKNNYPYAKISYSEYCTFSAQVRHNERQRVQDQMAKIIRHHKKSGYISAVKYQATIDEQNLPDWIMSLTPGPKAHAEFAVTHGRRPRKSVAAAEPEVGKQQPHGPRSAPREHPRKPLATSAQPTFNPPLVAEFTRRGITAKKTHELLARLKPGQDVVAQLEVADQLIQNARVPILNPPGFYIRLIESNTSVPDNFETAAKRKAREEKERQERERRAAEDARQLLESEYDEYCAAETDRYLQENPAVFESMRDAKWKENRERYSFSDEMITTIAANEAKREIRKQVPLPTFEEFLDRKRQGTDFSLKPVGGFPAPESETTTPLVAEEAVPTEPVVPASTETGSTQVNGGNPSGESGAAGQMGPVMSPADIPALEPLVVEPIMIELVSEVPPPPEPDPSATGPSMV